MEYSVIDWLYLRQVYMWTPRHCVNIFSICAGLLASVPIAFCYVCLPPIEVDETLLVWPCLSCLSNNSSTRYSRRLKRGKNWSNAILTCHFAPCRRTHCMQLYTLCVYSWMNVSGTTHCRRSLRTWCLYILLTLWNCLVSTFGRLFSMLMFLPVCVLMIDVDISWMSLC